jgi:hypothetical protein
MDDVKTDGRGKIVRLWRDWEEGRITDRRTRDDRRASSVIWTKDDVKTDGRGKREEGKTDGRRKTEEGRRKERGTRDDLEAEGR